MKGRNTTTGAAFKVSTYEEDFDAKKWRAELGVGGEATGGVRVTKENRDKVMEDTRETARRALGTMAQCEERGSDLFIELDRQNKQINRITNTVETIDQHMNASDRLLRGMESLSGAVYNYFTADDSYKKPPSPRRDSGPVTLDPERIKKKEEEKKAAEGGGGGWLPSLFGGAAAPQEKGTEAGSPPKVNYASMFEDKDVRDFFEETDGYLDQMNAKADLLKEMASGMGDELDDQNRKLARLGRQVDREALKVNRNNRKIEKLL